ncbi:MAG: hypothetical protein JXB10_12930 [Pirellulales bacterium]|nr:hypothetical protein [Pirellulales bacterium]
MKTTSGKVRTIRGLAAIAAAIVGFAILPKTVSAEPVSGFESRKPASEAELRYWLQNMVRDHRFSTAEIEAATGLSQAEIAAALKRFDIRPENRPARKKDAPLKMVPWPGGRAVSDWGEQVEPSRRRETKATVFAPWDDSSYVVLDMPEAIFSNLGLIYLAHVHGPTYWTNKGITLEKLEWNRLPGGGLDLTRKLPNGIEYYAKLAPTPRAIRMKLTLTNGTDGTLTDLRVQNCVFLKGMKGMENEAKPQVVSSKPYTAYGTADGRRWVITAWTSCDRCWNNPRNPCFHSDPKFPDCPPGKTQTLYGWLSFYEGDDVRGEFQRIDRTGWRNDLWKDQPCETVEPEGGASAPPAVNPESRRPPSEAELRYWLQNMVWDHYFTNAEIAEATGLSPKEIEEALRRFDIRPETRPERPANAPLRIAPWPGGRPLSNWGELDVTRQRETKVTIFAPWDEKSYVVYDVPEAIWSNFGLVYLAHVDVPTVWTKKGVTLEKLEWNRLPGGGLDLKRKLPNGIEYYAKFLPDRQSVRMKLTLTNGTDGTLTDLRVQNCVFLKGMKGMENEARPQLVSEKPYTAYGTADGRRWVITAWVPCDRIWNNPRNPCFHSDPKFPDCPPGKTEALYGWLSFYEGDDVREEFKRIDQTGWRNDLWKDRPGNCPLQSPLPPGEG